jgi:hypothetical protein
MRGQRLTLRQWIGWFGLFLVFLLALATFIWRSDIRIAAMDPQIPFQIYEPPPAPDYQSQSNWALWKAHTASSGSAAVFFVHSTTYDKHKAWIGPIGDPAADAYLSRVILPNYAGPFASLGTVSAPLYRQSSLYSRLTLRRDARDARAFAYGDIAAAFEVWLKANPEGPIVLAGVEQGAELLDRLIRDRIAPDPKLMSRMVSAYLVDALVAVDRLAPETPACTHREQAGCVVGWSQVGDDDDSAAARRLRRAQVWNERDRFEDLKGREALCVNPVIGQAGDIAVEARRHLGGANATGMEWGVRPAILDRQVSTQCRNGLLRHSKTSTESFSNRGSWADRRKARPYNLFFADMRADAEARLAVWQAESSAR